MKKLWDYIITTPNAFWIILLVIFNNFLLYNFNEDITLNLSWFVISTLLFSIYGKFMINEIITDFYQTQERKKNSSSLDYLRKLDFTREEYEEGKDLYYDLERRITSLFILCVLFIDLSSIVMFKSSIFTALANMFSHNFNL
jgi:hypothetical protein